MIVAHTLPMADHMGNRSYTVWLYDTDKPRGLSDLRAKYQCVGVLDCYRSHAEADRAISEAGYPLLVDVE